MLPRYLINAAITRALAEDIGRGDLTADSLVPAGMTAGARLMARDSGILAGIDLARAAFAALDPESRFELRVEDGQAVAAGTVVAHVSGSARALLTAERVALN